MAVSGAALLWIVVVQVALTAAPGIAATLLAARCGVRNVPVLLAIGLAGTGIVAMLAFWAYYLDPSFGKVCACGFLLISVAVAAWSGWTGKLGTRLLHDLTTPLALWVLGSVFLVFFGFMHGGTDHPISMAATRFSSQLPSDNDIPLFFSEWFFFHGHHGVPPVFPGKWLASDRPPLQIGYVLAERPFAWDATGLHYQVLGIVLQQLWIVGLWTLLVAARVRRTTRALIVLTVLVSGVAIVNGFYVWPKMLPAAFLLAAAGLVVTPQWPALRRNPRAAALVASLLALALLGHGSSVFGIIPLVVIAAFRGLPSWRWVAVSLLTAALLLVPWSAYQKYGDPPGDRLTKWMLAGVVEIDSRSTSEAVLDAYREAGVGGALHNKAENFVTMLGGGPAVNDAKHAVDAVDSGEFGPAIREARTIFFFYLLPSLGLLLLAPVVIVASRDRGRRSPADWRFAVVCFAIVLIGCITWGLLLFGSTPARADIHVGSLALPVLALCGAVAGLRATFPRFADLFVGANALAMLLLYAPALDPLPGTSYSVFAAVVAVASLVGFGVLAFPRGESRPALGRSASPG
jgi:hypothetical protein